MNYYLNSPLPLVILSVMNIAFANGNLWMYITGAVLGIIAIMDILDV